MQAVIDAAEDEAIVTFAAGSYDWTGGVINLGAIDGVTLRCETVGTCLVAHDGNLA